MSIHRVDLRTNRHRKNAKHVIDSVCSIIEGLDYEVAGFAVVVWADDGTAGMSYQTGGVVEAGGLSIYVHQKLSRLVSQHSEF